MQWNDDIDWEAQWRTHSPGFKDGYWSFSGDFCGIRLKPGPGFGDFSHPSTRLVLERMRTVVPRRAFVDIGCGSGILSLCAIALGAAQAYGIDIDPQALVHARDNVKLNGLEEKISCHFAEELREKEVQGKCVAVMNMIESEQVVAWGSLSFIHDRIDTIITSGILEADERGISIYATHGGGLLQVSPWKVLGVPILFLNRNNSTKTEIWIPRLLELLFVDLYTNTVSEAESFNL